MLEALFSAKESTTVIDRQEEMPRCQKELKQQRMQLNQQLSPSKWALSLSSIMSFEQIERQRHSNEKHSWQIVAQRHSIFMYF